jgi:hypothetical protein
VPVSPRQADRKAADERCGVYLYHPAELTTLPWRKASWSIPRSGAIARRADGSVILQLTGAHACKHPRPPRSRSILPALTGSALATTPTSPRPCSPPTEGTVRPASLPSVRVGVAPQRSGLRARKANGPRLTRHSHSWWINEPKPISRAGMRSGAGRPARRAPRQTLNPVRVARQAVRWRERQPAPHGADCLRVRCKAPSWMIVLQGTRPR